jgi:gas vesicle protein
MNTNADMQEHRRDRFGIGLLAGTFVGAGLMMWLAPRMGSALRQRMTDSARTLGQRASDTYRQASTHAAEAIDELARKGQAARDDVADAVVRGAREVERVATAAKSEGVLEARPHSAADRSSSKPRSL